MSRFFHSVNNFFKRLFLIFIAMLFCACSGGTLVGNPEATKVTDTTGTFTDETELEEYLKDEYATNILPYSTLGYTIDKAAPPSSEANEIDSDSITGFSENNIQEQGVDESDKVKSDGIYFYVAGQKKISIIKAVPPDEMALIRSWEVEGNVNSLFLYKNILVILYTPVNGTGSTWQGTGLNSLDDRIEIGLPYWTPVNSQTGLILLDISSPSDPVRIRQAVIDGYLVSSRLANGKLHLVQQFLPDLPALELWYDGSDENRIEVIEANKAKLDTLSLNDLLPSWVLIDGLGYSIDMGLLVDSEDLYHPAEPSGGSIVTIATISLDDLSGNIQTKGIVADVHQTHASLRALYLSSTNWNYQSDSKSTKDLQTTVIHKFDLTGKEVTYEGMGNIKGQIMDRFSMGEYGDVLRIATNSWDMNDEISRNHLFCLKMLEDGFTVIGSIEGIAHGKTMSSAYFFGSRGFLIFSGRVDPLLILDLSDPAQPVVAGKVNVPGYSTYIHPVGEDHLIIMGRDIKENLGTVLDQGIGLSIFDITNLDEPKLIEREWVGSGITYSEVFSNHKAFTFRSQENLMVFPVINMWGSDETAFAGIYVFRVSTGIGFELLGKISTTSSKTYSNWTRGIFVDTSIYAVNEWSVRSAQVDDIEHTVNELVFTGDD